MREYNERVHWTLKKNVPRRNKVVWVEEEEDGTVSMYHTESSFWYYFFHPNEDSKKCKGVSKCTKKEYTVIHASHHASYYDENKLEYWM